MFVSPLLFRVAVSVPDGNEGISNRGIKHMFYYRMVQVRNSIRAIIPKSIDFVIDYHICKTMSKHVTH